MPGEPIFTIRRMVTSSAALREAITLKKKLTGFSSHQAEKGVAL
jgi:hypothetical protein